MQVHWLTAQGGENSSNVHNRCTHKCTHGLLSTKLFSPPFVVFHPITECSRCSRSYCQKKYTRLTYLFYHFPRNFFNNCIKLNSNSSRYCLRPQMEYGENLRNPNGIKIIRSGAENNFNAIRIWRFSTYSIEGSKQYIFNTFSRSFIHLK